MISFQTSQHNSNRAGGLEIPSERHALCNLQAFGYAYADVPTGYEGPCVQTHPPAAANLPCLTGSSAARRRPQFLRSACPHLGAASALTQGHSPLESFTRLTGSVLLCCVCAFLRTSAIARRTSDWSQQIRFDGAASAALATNCIQAAACQGRRKAPWRSHRDP